MPPLQHNTNEYSYKHARMHSHRHTDTAIATRRKIEEKQKRYKIYRKKKNQKKKPKRNPCESIGIIYENSDNVDAQIYRLELNRVIAVVFDDDIVADDHNNSMLSIE